MNQEHSKSQNTAMPTSSSTTTALVLLALLTTTTTSHGLVTSPPSRVVGPAMKANCGEQLFNNQASDAYGPIQQMAKIGASQRDYNAAACNLALCKGYTLADSSANVQTFSPGQVVPMTVDIRAPHTGTANVSIVDARTGAMIGEPLVEWAVYASNSAPIPAEQRNFDVVVPAGLAPRCQVVGDCVVMWWWDARSVDQTYESCVDFVVA